MDLKTGILYNTKEEALANGVPESDIIEIRSDNNLPIIKFSSGPFKNRIYRKTENGNLIRVK
jgi:hypothetical protein